jgi:hypothetical protein
MCLLPSEESSDLDGCQRVDTAAFKQRSTSLEEVKAIRTGRARATLRTQTNERNPGGTCK